MNVAKDFYTSLTGHQKADMASEYLAGPRSYVAGVHPNATKAEMEQICQKRFHDKFDASGGSPTGIYHDHIDYSFVKASITDRLRNDGFLPKGLNNE